MKNRLASSAAAAAPSSGLLLSATLLLALSSLPLPARAQFDELIAALPFECQDGGYAFVDCVNNNALECGLPCAGDLGLLTENIPGEYASDEEVCSFITFASQTLGSCCGTADCVALLDEVVVCTEGELCSYPNPSFLPDECGGELFEESCGTCIDSCLGGLLSISMDDYCVFLDEAARVYESCCDDAECVEMFTGGMSCAKETCAVPLDALFQLPDECGGDEASKKLEEECGECVDDCSGALLSLIADGTPDDPCLLFDNLEMTYGGCCANAECLTLVSEGVSCIKEQIFCDGPGIEFEFLDECGGEAKEAELEACIEGDDECMEGCDTAFAEALLDIDWLHVDQCEIYDLYLTTAQGCCQKAECVAIFEEMVTCTKNILMCGEPGQEVPVEPDPAQDPLLALIPLLGDCLLSAIPIQGCIEGNGCGDACLSPEGALAGILNDGLPSKEAMCPFINEVTKGFDDCCAACVKQVDPLETCMLDQYECADEPEVPKDGTDKTDGDDGEEEKNILDGTSQMDMVFGTTDICQAENDAVNACFQSNISKCEQCLLDFVNFLSKNGSQNADINCEKGTTAICDVLDCCDNCAEKLEDFIKCAQENTQDMIDGGETCQVKCSGGESGRYVAWAAFAASAVVAGLGILAI
eukprot:CAMPEP_0183292324 /NCGR_PEP_ID=MMETSP0160_2-20130417/1415_1 /TAXON_ID=2839 ORGANISM="Odontella Sinensis, Strain Grunow 1884" /NCGR_SAMPLE_ID=MMETSP0160_2 /ASSEMBLY_ACC=CAM_ASM_000250 /LENGTH=643 /DNA_ID=CAMNT_0025453255 /DNA_START=138 /DNA_END=2069 /DNA_ORIENTATION=+